jgi:aldehyde dehydrogenase family 7 protein A1
MVSRSFTFNQYPFLKDLGLSEVNPGCYRNGEWVAHGDEVISINPHNNKPIAATRLGSAQDYEDCVSAMQSEKLRWMSMTAPARGEIIRQIGEAMRKKKDALGLLITLEMGKSKTEGLGEV